MLLPSHVPTKKNRGFFAPSCACHYPTVTATSHHGSSAHFNRDIGYVIIDVFLLRRRVATQGRGCRPWRVDFLRNKSMRSDNHSLPQQTESLTACAQSSTTRWPVSQASTSLWGGLLLSYKRVYYYFIIFILILFLLHMLTPTLLHPLSSQSRQEAS